MTSSGIDYADFFAIVGLYNGMYNPIKIRIVCFHVAQDLFRDCLHVAPPCFYSIPEQTNDSKETAFKKK